MKTIKMAKEIITQSGFKNICQKIHWLDQRVISREIEYSEARIELLGV